MNSNDKISVPTWEIPAFAVGYVSTVKDIPEIVNKLIPLYQDVSEFPVWFNRITMFGYGVLLVLLAGIFLIKERFKRAETDAKVEGFGAGDDLSQIMQRLTRLRYFKSLGIEYIFDLIRDRAKISLFDSFVRPDDWGFDSETFKRTYRLWVKDSHSYEIRMKKDFSAYKIRKTEAIDSEKFEELKEYSIFELDIKKFGFISFPLTLFSLIHLLLLPFYKCLGNFRWVRTIALISYFFLIVLIAKYNLIYKYILSIAWKI